jgi:hypothetical protein
VGPTEAAGTAHPADLAWRLLTQRLATGRPNARLGLVQAQHIFARAAGLPLMRSGLVRVRIPANLIRLGEDGWRRDRFEDGWWMERLRDMGVPFKAVVELWPRFTDEQHADHAARLVRRAGPNVVIIGNELNAVDGYPRSDPQAEIARYLDRYEVMHAAIQATAPGTRVQLYGEAYYGEPWDPNAFLRRVLTALRQRGLPPPDLAGMHVYDRAEVIPRRAEGYRRLLDEFGLRIPLSVEEVGPRCGVVDSRQEARLRQQPAENPEAFPDRLAEVRAAGWLTEDEQADLVAQHLATAAAAADQAQVFCAADFDAEADARRGLVSGFGGRGRPALRAFAFLQRLLADTASVRLRRAPEDGGVTAIDVNRSDGIAATIAWSSALPDERTAGARALDLPPLTFVCDAQGQLLHAPQPHATTVLLPAATTPEAGGAVRIFFS